MVGIPLLFLTNVVLARTLSVNEFGAFSFAISIATVLAVPLTGGLPILLTREVAAYSQTNQWAECNGLLSWCYLFVLKSSSVLLLGALVALAATGNLSAAPAIALTALIPLLGLNGVRNGFLKGIGRPALAELPTQILQPIVMIAGYLCLYISGWASEVSALLWYVAACFLVFLVATALQIRVRPGQLDEAGADQSDLQRWRRALLPLTLVSAATVILAQLAIILLGLIDQENGVAIYRVAERGAMLVAMPMMFINTILGPYFVKAARVDDKAGLSAVARQSARLTTGLSFPIATTLLLFGQQLLGFAFGQPYGELSYWPMAVLIAGQLVSVAMGSAAYMLAVTGYEKLALQSSIIGIVVLFGAGMALIPGLGVIGAALAVTLAILSAKIVAVWFCWRVCQTWTGVL